MTPNALSVHTRFTIASPSRLAVSSSWTFIRKPPSPEMVTTCRSRGSTSLAAIAAGTAKPIAAAPFEIRTVFGWCAGQRRETQSLCAPTSEMRTSSGAHHLAQVAQHPLRLHREAVVGALLKRQPQELAVGRGRQPGRRLRRDQVPEVGQDRADPAGQLDVGDVVLVDLGRDRVDADDRAGRGAGSSRRAPTRRGRSRRRRRGRPCP